MAVVVCLLFFLAISGHSNATYCMCKDGLSDSILQKNIDYACGAGASCLQILQAGSCYNPNTVKDHCNYAVNSYYQMKNQATGSCDFAGTATTSITLSSSNSACVYPASPSTAVAGTTPTTTPSTTPSTSTTPSITTTPSTGSTTATTPSVFGLGPTGSGSITNSDSKASVTLRQNAHVFFSLTATFFFSGPMLLRL